MLRYNAQTMKKIKALLFDVDGTLIRTGGAGIRSLERSFKLLYDIENPLEGVTVAGNTDPCIFREIIAYQMEGRKADIEEERKFFEYYLRFLEEEILQSENYKVLPGIHEILDQASSSAEFLVGLATGNMQPGAKIKLERGKLNGYFNFGGFGSDSSDRPRILKIAVERAEKKFGIKLTPDQVIIIGDTPRDLSAARAIGAKALCVATGGYTYQELKDCKPDHVTENFEEIEGFFEFVNAD